MPLPHEERARRFDALWPVEQFTERSLSIEEIEKRQTYYSKELIGMKAFIEEEVSKALSEHLQRVREEIKELEVGTMYEWDEDAVVRKNEVLSLPSLTDINQDGI